MYALQCSCRLVACRTVRARGCTLCTVLADLSPAELKPTARSVVWKWVPLVPPGLAISTRQQVSKTFSPRPIISSSLIFHSHLLLPFPSVLALTSSSYHIIVPYIPHSSPPPFFLRLALTLHEKMAEPVSYTHLRAHETS